MAAKKPSKKETDKHKNKSEYVGTPNGHASDILAIKKNIFTVGIVEGAIESLLDEV